MEGNPDILAISFGDYLAGAAPAARDIGAAFRAFGKTMGRAFIVVLPCCLCNPGLAPAPAPGYMGGWFLYLVIFIGLAGALCGGFGIEYPAINLSGLKSLANGKNIFPILFITIACGACSGFHGIVSSGTTSKQVKKERDSIPITYGAMLLEGLVAVLAIVTVIILPKGSPLLKADPNLIYAGGIARSLGLFNIPYEAGLLFALLAFSTFVYDTLDVCTRLARYILQELTGLSSKKGGLICGIASVFLPFVFLMASKEKGYLAAWPLFGASNQLFGQHYSARGIAMAYSLGPQALVYYPADDIYVDGDLLGIG